MIVDMNNSAGKPLAGIQIKSLFASVRKKERESNVKTLKISQFNQAVDVIIQTINYAVITLTDDHISYGNHHNYNRSYAGFIFIMAVGF